MTKKKIHLLAPLKDLVWLKTVAYALRDVVTICFGPRVALLFISKPVHVLSLSTLRNIHSTNESDCSNKQMVQLKWENLSPLILLPFSSVSIKKSSLSMEVSSWIAGMYMQIACSFPLFETVATWNFLDQLRGRDFSSSTIPTEAGESGGNVTFSQAAKGPRLLQRHHTNQGQ